MTAAANGARPIRTTGAPARASMPPKYPPTAPAPTTAMRGQLLGAHVVITEMRRSMSRSVLKR